VADAVELVLTKLWADLSAFYWDAVVALNVNGISGDYVEFGSTGGNTLRLAHEVLSQTPVPRHMWAFDSFEGLPEATGPLDEHPAFAPGYSGGGLQAFHDLCERNGVPRTAYTAVQGFYEDSLAAIGDGAPRDIALAYVDCNLYSSTVTVLDFLAPRLKHGMIVAFDDYFCWSSTNVSGERAALGEFLADHPQWNFHRFKDVHWGGVAFVVEDATALERSHIARG
jgi:hypothetical protein